MTLAVGPADVVADNAASYMLSGDAPSKIFGFKLLRCGPGESELEFVVNAESLNVFGTCHGGVIFTLADTAFSIACNSYGQASMAQQCSITFIRPVHSGERLLAKVIERSRTKRTAIFDCSVTSAKSGKTIAEFRGHSRSIDDRVAHV